MGQYAGGIDTKLEHLLTKSKKEIARISLEPYKINSSHPKSRSYGMTVILNFKPQGRW